MRRESFRKKTIKKGKEVRFWEVVDHKGEMSCAITEDDYKTEQTDSIQFFHAWSNTFILK